jgi:hypothetical protein
MYVFLGLANGMIIGNLINKFHNKDEILTFGDIISFSSMLAGAGTGFRIDITPLTG